MKRILIYLGIILLLIVGVLAGNLFIFNKSSGNVSTGEPIPEYGTERAALLVIDVQEATTGTVSLNQAYQDQAETLINDINWLSARADSLGIPFIVITNVVSNPLINLLNNSMAEGSEGAQPDRRLTTGASHLLTKKKNDAFSNPDLDILLSDLEVNHLYITGLDATYCVNGTLRGALNRGYRVTVIDDAVISAPEHQKKVMFEQFRELGASFISLNQFPNITEPRNP
jgi:nicotinamidase-related amidase